jgi:hypothetical protein
VVSSLFRVDDGSGVTWASCATQRMKASWAARTSPWAKPAGRSTHLTEAGDADALRDGLESGDFVTVPVTPNERIEALAAWLEAENPFPAGIGWEWAATRKNRPKARPSSARPSARRWG